VLPGLEYFPLGQTSQPSPAPFTFWPAGHLSQVTEPSTRLKVPATQSSQEVDWAAPVYFPMAQRSQRIVPGLSEYVPATQPWQ